jgi:hypothetical protein
LYNMFHIDHWELSEYPNCKGPKSRTVKKSSKIITTSKSVRYAKSSTIILIPSREEYEEAGIDLWYSNNDQIASKCQVSDEVRSLMSYNPVLTFEQAMSYLYQPRDKFVDSIRLDEIDERKALRILCVDSNETDLSSSQDISQSLQKYNRWIITYEYTRSHNSALKYIADGKDSMNKFDLVLINTNIGGDYISLVNQFRLAYGDDSLIGLINSSGEITEDELLHAKEKKVDFMWKSIHNSIELLPIVLASRA